MGRHAFCPVHTFEGTALTLPPADQQLADKSKRQGRGGRGRRSPRQLVQPRVAQGAREGQVPVALRVVPGTGVEVAALHSGHRAARTACSACWSASADEPICKPALPPFLAPVCAPPRRFHQPA